MNNKILFGALIGLIAFAGFSIAQTFTVQYSIIVKVAPINLSKNSTMCSQYLGCAETDSGLDYLTAGNIRASYLLDPNDPQTLTCGQYSDVCESDVFNTPSTHLFEYVCGQNVAPGYPKLAAMVYIDCAEQNMICKAGACVKNVTVNQTHLKCINYTCTEVQGTGSNECSSKGSPCGTPPTHLECIGSICTEIQGSGSNQCTPKNSVCGTNQTNQTNATLPDLKTTIFSKTSAACSGGGHSNSTNVTNVTCSISFKGTIKNIGKAAAGNFTVTFFDDTNSKVIADVQVAGLKNGKYTKVNATYSSIAQGKYNLTLIADSRSVIIESNENNNKKTIAVKL